MARCYPIRRNLRAPNKTSLIARLSTKGLISLNDGGVLLMHCEEEPLGPNRTKPEQMNYTPPRHDSGTRSN